MANILGRITGSAGFLYHRTLRLTRRGRWPLTIGVRIIVRDPGDHVLLVRHTYAPGWHFPGGAIDPRETAVDAAQRELREEALVESISTPKLMGIYFSLTENKSDHIVVFETGDWRPVEGERRVLEIAEARFFPIRDLPKGTTGGTRRRLTELSGETPRSDTW
jgi:ADP-ribose pyrophosphatase YjhB (NUDIX family)